MKKKTNIIISPDFTQLHIIDKLTVRTITNKITIIINKN